MKLCIMYFIVLLTVCPASHDRAHPSIYISRLESMDTRYPSWREGSCLCACMARFDLSHASTDALTCIELCNNGSGMV